MLHGRPHDHDHARWLFREQRPAYHSLVQRFFTGPGGRFELGPLLDSGRGLNFTPQRRTADSEASRPLQTSKATRKVSCMTHSRFQNCNGNSKIEKLPVHHTTAAAVTATAALQSSRGTSP